jgi:hypothetical protein
MKMGCICRMLDENTSQRKERKLPPASWEGKFAL